MCAKRTPKTVAFKTQGIPRPWTAIAKNRLGYSSFGTGETKKEAVAEAEKARAESPEYQGAMR